MDKALLKKEFDNLKAQILQVFRNMMEDAANPKTGAFTLDKSSRIWRNTNIDTEGMNVIKVIVPYYIKYIDGIDDDGKQWDFARRPWYMVMDEKPLFRWMPPFDVIYAWMRKRGMSTDSVSVYQMRMAIALNGIKPRNVFKGWEKETDKAIEEFFDNIFNEIITDLKDYFNK